MEFRELLEMQKQLDEAIEKPRQNGFVPRERKLTDILLSLDDEFNEWLKELPQEYNFKTWKLKEYDRKKELEELTDVLFFFLSLCNFYQDEKTESMEEVYNMRKINSHFSGTFTGMVKTFKFFLFRYEYELPFKVYWNLVKFRKFSDEEIINRYQEKWQKNMKRIEGEWSNI